MSTAAPTLDTAGRPQAATPDLRSLAAYRRFLESVLGGQTTLPTTIEIVTRLRAAEPELFRPERDLTSLRYLVEIVVRIVVVGALMMFAWSRGIYLAVAALCVLQSINYFGVITLLHDLTHGSFFSMPWLNRALGQLLGPLVLVRFNMFSTAHPLHHRMNQTYEDPNWPGSGDVRKTSTKIIEVIRAGYGRVFAVLPKPLQRVVFWTIGMSFGALGVAMNNEFGPLGHLKTKGARLDVAIHLIVWAGLVFLLGPIPVLLFFLAPIPLALMLAGPAFMTHLHQRSIYPLVTDNRDYELLIFNINDLTLGRVLDRLGFYFARYHVAHHFVPTMPFHRLKALSKLIEREYGTYLLPVRPLDFEYLTTGLLPVLPQPLAHVFLVVGERRFRCTQALLEARD